MNRHEVKIAFLGCGHIARAHLAELHKMPGVRVKACWNRREEFHLAEQFQAASGAEYCTDDYQRIADDPEVDGVYICTMQNFRVMLLEAMAKSGKAVFMEKPLALYPSEFKQMAEILRQYPILFQSGYKIKFNSLIKSFQEKQLHPEIIYSHVFDCPWSDRAPAANQKVGGGHILSQGVYATETLRVLADSVPVSVMAMLNERNSRNCCHGSLAAVFRFANGTIGNLALTDNAEAPEGISKFFTEATGPGWGLSITERFTCLRQTAPLEKETEERFMEDGFYNQSVSFIEKIRNGKNNSDCSFLDGAIPSLMIFKALESARNNTSVKIDVHAWLEHEMQFRFPLMPEPELVQV